MIHSLLDTDLYKFTMMQAVLHQDPAAHAQYRFRGRCRTSFGIGTNLTNDTAPKALQIVLKMVACNGQPVAKLSDSPGKTMVDDEGYLRYPRCRLSMSRSSRAARAAASA